MDKNFEEQGLLSKPSGVANSFERDVKHACNGRDPDTKQENYSQDPIVDPSLGCSQQLRQEGPNAEACGKEESQCARSKVMELKANPPQVHVGGWAGLMEPSSHSVHNSAYTYPFSPQTFMQNPVTPSATAPIDYARAQAAQAASANFAYPQPAHQYATSSSQPGWQVVSSPKTLSPRYTYEISPTDRGISPQAFQVHGGSAMQSHSQVTASPNVDQLNCAVHNAQDFVTHSFSPTEFNNNHNVITLPRIDEDRRQSLNYNPYSQSPPWGPGSLAAGHSAVHRVMEKGVGHDLNPQACSVRRSSNPMLPREYTQDNYVSASFSRRSSNEIANNGLPRHIGYLSNANLSPYTPPARSPCTACKRMVQDRLSFYLCFNMHPACCKENFDHFRRFCVAYYAKDRYKAPKPAPQGCLCCTDTGGSRRNGKDRFISLINDSSIVKSLMERWVKKVKVEDDRIRKLCKEVDPDIVSDDHRHTLLSRLDCRVKQKAIKPLVDRIRRRQQNQHTNCLLAERLSASIMRTGTDFKQECIAYTDYGDWMKGVPSAAPP